MTHFFEDGDYYPHISKTMFVIIKIMTYHHVMQNYTLTLTPYLTCLIHELKHFDEVILQQRGV